MATEDALSKNTAKTSRAGRRSGVVVSDKRDKTITVEIKRLVKHPKYGKYIYRSSRFHAHDGKNEAKQGDRVEILAVRPMSKQKRWKLLRVVRRAVVLDEADPKGAGT